MILIIAIGKCKKKNTGYELIFSDEDGEVLLQNNSDKVHEAQWSDTEPLIPSTQIFRKVYHMEIKG